jgi:hypothetical protein
VTSLTVERLDLLGAFLAAVFVAEPVPGGEHREGDTGEESAGSESDHRFVVF